MKRRGLDLFEWASVMAIVLLAAAMTLPALARAREGAHRASCADNLRQLGASLRLSAVENQGFFPAMKSLDCFGKPAGWSGTIDLAAVFPDYLTDLDVLVCPENAGSALERWDNGDGVLAPCEVLGIPYVYVGWVLPFSPMEAEDVDAFAGNVESAARLFVRNPGAVHNDWGLDVPVLGREKLDRLREGVARYQVTDICNEAATCQSRANTAVMWDAVQGETGFSEPVEGANVLFMDGHVEFVTWHDGPGRFPVNEAGAALSRAVAEAAGMAPSR